MLRNSILIMLTILSTLGVYASGEAERTNPLPLLGPSQA
jgi:hypothetical protein